MHPANSSLSANLFLAAAIVMCALAVSGSWSAMQKSEARGQPHKLVTLGQSIGSCSTRSFQSGLKMVGCSEGKRGEKRGGAYFMKPPE